MRKQKYTTEQQHRVVLRLDRGERLVDISRELGIAEKTLSRWRAKYAGLSLSDLQKLKHLEDENTRLKKLVADLSLDNQILKEVVEKK